MTEPAESEQVRRLLDERLLVTLRLLIGMLAALFIAFFLYNAVDLPPGLRERALVYDALLVVGSAALYVLLSRGGLPPRLAHPATSLVTLAVVGNILMVQHGLQDSMYTVYVGIVIIGVGSAVLDWRYLGALLVGIWALWLPVALGTTADLQELGVWAFTLVASSSLSAAVFAGRVRNERSLLVLRHSEAERARELEAALKDAEEARRALDEKVADRTRELSEANTALRQQVEERRALEDRLHHSQRLEAIGQLAGGVAHDFNNLLTAIRGNLEVLHDDLPDGPQREVVEESRFAVERAADVTRQLLAFSRRQVLETRVLELGEALSRMEAFLDRLLDDPIELTVERPPDGLWVEADRSQVELSVLNLVVNARDALPEGGHITVRLHPERRDDVDFAVIDVVDDGIGMDEATVDRVFEPFFTTKDVTRGTGLGLATVYGILEQHDGEVRVESTPGQGTRFELWLPRVQAPATPSPSGRRTMPRGSGTVLLVEDEETVRRVGQRLLTRLGYDVLVAASGEEALEHARSDRPIDLLWTDVLMPGMSGVQLTHEVRALRPGIKVLLASGYTGRELGPALEELPPDCRFLSKPYVSSDLATALAQLTGSMPDEPGAS